MAPRYWRLTGGNRDRRGHRDRPGRRQLRGRSCTSWSPTSPASGPAEGCNTVVITGRNFTGPLTVRFGGTATSFTIDSASQITSIAPPGAGTMQVSVAGNGGGAAASPKPTSEIGGTAGPACRDLQSGWRHRYLLLHLIGIVLSRRQRRNFVAVVGEVTSVWC
ncbi:IPT/TIG domain-containing protein [Nocardia noduli]|uniref:IPT/TIG domain-containing protein n=1 Tax=Nocardia noduli TaxID=2815722 RepID=UPI001C2336A6